MLTLKQPSLIATLTVLIGMNAAWSDDNPFGDQPADQIAPEQNIAEQNTAKQKLVKQWIEQLDSDSLTTRQKARAQLIQAGKAAVPSLAKAALSDKRDLIVHSIDILAEIRNTSEDDETKKAASLALQVLSESNKPSTAKRAKLALEAKKGGGIQAFPDWDKPGAEFGGNPFRNAGNRSVSVSNINGIKTITVKEAGKTTTLQDQPDGTIRVRTTGDGQPKEFVVKNREELKKKDPAAFALYQQHGGNAGGGGGVRFGFGPMGPFNGNVGANPARANAMANDINGFGGNAANELMIQQLTELKKRMAGMPEMQRMLDQQINNLKR